MRIASRRLATLGTFGLAALLSAAPARAAAPAEKVLPQSTLAFVKIDNAAQLREAFSASQIGQLVADPAMKPLKDDVAEKLKDANDKTRARIGLSIGELLRLPEGEVSLAIISTPDKDQPVAVLVSADAGKNEKAMSELLEKLTVMAREDKAKVTTEEFAGLTLTHIEPAEKAENDKEKPPHLVWARRGSNFTLATAPEAIKDVLSKADGRDDALAAKPAYQAVRKQAGDAGQITWFLDLEQVIQLVVKSVGEQNGNAAQIQAQLELTGLDGLKALGGRAGVGVGGYDQLSKAFLYAPGESKGLLRLFVMPQADLKPQPWVPATIASYQSISWDLDAAYKALTDLLDQVLPGVLAGVEQQLAGPKGDGLNFQKDVFGPLGDRITVVSDLKKQPDPKAPPAQRMLFGVALEDSQAFQNTVGKLLTLANASPKKRQFQGTTIYDFDLPELPNAEATGITGPLSVAVAKDTLFVSTEPTLLEQVLRGGPGLAESEGYRDVAAKLPPRSSTQSYQRAEDQARAVYDMIKSGQLKQALQAGAQANNVNVGDLIDPAKLPDFSVFAKYLTQSAGFGVMTPDGVTFTQFSLKKGQP